MRDRGPLISVFEESRNRLRVLRRKTNTSMVRLASDAIDQYVDRYEAAKAKTDPSKLNEIK